MTQGFYGRVTRSASFRDIVGARGLTVREAGLLNLAAAIAAKDEANLRVKLAEQQGELEKQELKTQVAVWAVRSGAAVRQGMLFLITPYSQLALPRPLEGPEEAPFVSELEAPAEDAQRKATVQSPSEKLLESFPKWTQEPIRFLANRIGKLSPLTTAILFALVIAGAVAFANYQYGSIERSYKLALSDLETLKGGTGKIRGSSKGTPGGAEGKSGCRAESRCSK